jgi:hypothetical protein
MGGSGGGGYFKDDPESIKEKLRTSERKTLNAEYESEIAQLLSSRLGEVNYRDHNAINRHMEEIRTALGKELEGTIDLLFGGSISKHTYVDGLSDVDSLVILDNCELADRPPLEAKAYFAKCIRDRFPQTTVTEGTLAVTVHFSDAEIQLLPAVSCEGHVKIPDRTGKDWSRINPQAFTTALTRVNQEVGRKVVPVIKLAKAIIAKLPERQRISGYHAESLAVEIFRDYRGDAAIKPMLNHFFSRASQLVRIPTADRTGQSLFVDEHLGTAGSLERAIVADAFSRVSRRMNNADAAGSINEWKSLLDE